MKPSLRTTLAKSHVAAISIAILLLWSLDWTFSALWTVLVPLATYVTTAIAIRGIPYWAAYEARTFAFQIAIFLSGAVISWSAAWLLSRWVYGTSPLKCLSSYRGRIARRNHV